MPLFRILLALLVALAVTAGPVVAAGFLHTGPNGCGMLQAAPGHGQVVTAKTHDGHAKHPGHGGGEGHASRKLPASAVPCCLAGCLAVTLAEAPLAADALRPAKPAATVPLLIGANREPADPPPRRMVLLPA